MSKGKGLEDLKKAWRTIAQDHFKKIATQALRRKCKEMRDSSRVFFTVLYNVNCVLIFAFVS